ncbi:MAG: transcription termination/antitermination protein NusA [Pirellulaceae bacterium]|nr:MAG: transcription termination/antitermination protein NusA [Pirellulaceae bacterium]
MNPNEILRLVDGLHREKHIDTEVVFSAIESALVTALRKFRGEDADIHVSIDRKSGEITARVDDDVLDQTVIGRIGAQTAKQVIIQKIKEAERDALLAEFQDQVGELVTGTVQRNDRGVTIVQVGNVEAILPRSEQISGESYHHGDRVKAIIYEVKAAGNRVKVILSRTKPQLVQRLFEQEIPEIAEGVIEIKAISREPGQRSKVAVTSSDQRVDCVGACVGVRGNRIKNITSELAGERIDIVRWSPDPMELIPAALQPAEVDQVLLCDMIGRAIVLVKDDQLSQAIGKYGQNVRLASKLVGWDIEIMTAEELEDQIDRAINAFMALEGMTDELAQRLVEQGYLSYDDLSVIEPEALMEMGGLTEEQVDLIVEQADERAEEAERIAAEEKRLKKERAAIERMAAENPAMASALEAAQQAQAGDSTSPDAASTPDQAASVDQSPEEDGTPAAELPAEEQAEASPTASNQTQVAPAAQPATVQPPGENAPPPPAADGNIPEQDDAQEGTSSPTIAESPENDSAVSESEQVPAEATSTANSTQEEAMDKTNATDQN